MNGQPYARLNSYHGPKRQLLGNHAGHVAPAWRNVHELPGQTIALAKTRHNMQEQGSRILLSMLPVDVGEKEVEVSVRDCE
jgi:THO complex subunit 4